MISPRKHDDSAHGYVDPSVRLNVGLWTLFAGASAFLALRVWIKVTRRHGLWYDDHILLISWVRLSPPNTPHSMSMRTSANHIQGNFGDQQQPDISRVRNWLCNQHVGRSHAHTHNHHFLWHVDQPGSYQDSFRRYLTQVNQELDASRIPMGTLVLHCLNERLHGYQSHRSVGKDLWQAKL
jgi:hypothetical protein